MQILWIEAVPVAEYQEKPFQGSLQRTKIRDDVTYNLEFKLASKSPNTFRNATCELYKSDAD